MLCVPSEELWVELVPGAAQASGRDVGTCSFDDSGTPRLSFDEFLGGAGSSGSVGVLQHHLETQPVLVTTPAVD